jgi:hypothetical protein
VTRRHCGVLPEPEGYAAVSAGPWLSTYASPPARSNNAQFMASIKDQSPESACTGFALGCALETVFAAKGQPIPELAYQGIYTLGRMEGRASSGVKLTDNGAVPAYVMQALTDWGAPAAKDWAFDPSTVNEDADLAKLESADRFKLAGFRRIDTFGDAREDEVKRALAAGIMVSFTTNVTQAFEDYSGRGVLKYDGAPTLGGHALYFLDYESTPSGIVLTIPNSWSSSWGDWGIGRADRSFLDVCENLYVLDVAVQP